MKRTRNDDGVETIQLARPKANYAALEEGVDLEWHAGAYRCTDHRFETYGDRLDRECRERQIDNAFLAALDHLTAQHRAVSHSPHANRTYAPKVIAADKLVDGCSWRDLEKSMRRLFAANRIIADAQLSWQKADRHCAIGLARKELA
jgi:RecA-family ATPase